MTPRLPHILGLGFLLSVAFLLQRFSGALAAGPVMKFPRFTDVTHQAGLGIKITLGDEVTEYLIEVKSLGVCFLDFDNDGYQDIFFVNGSSRKMQEAGRPPRDYLFRNNGDGTFAEVTARANLGDSGWHTGCTTGDYDNDGHVDLFLTNWGPNKLYHNEGDGTFTDVTAAAGVAGPVWSPPKWSMGAAFGDIDNDGDLDLYVPNFVKFDYDILPPPHLSTPCKMKGVPIACAPDMYEAQQDLLYRNNGDRTFSDVSQSAGIIRERPGKGFGVVFSDFDNDRDQDMYVICDAGQNFYYVNDGKGQFTDYSMASGTAVDGFGNSQGSMGVWVGDVNHDGFQDMVIGNFIQQIKTLYINQGDNLFLDQTSEWGIGDLAYNYSTWGIGMPDFDNDGWLDLWVTNGHTMEQLEKFYPDDTFTEPNYVLRNEEGKRFVDLSKLAGIYSIPNKVGRGTTFADIDNDGDTDVLVTNKNDSPTLWRNEGGNGLNWIVIRAEGVKSNRSGFGARVVAKAAGMQQTFEVRSSESFLSSHDPRVFIGLGVSEEADIEIRWPSGQLDKHERVAARKFYHAQEGTPLVLDPQVKTKEKVR